MCEKSHNYRSIIMTDIAIADDPTGHIGTDIRVFGKWSGAEVQISDMSLEVRCLSFRTRHVLTNVLLSRIIFLAPNSQNFFHIQLVDIK